MFTHSYSRAFANMLRQVIHYSMLASSVSKCLQKEEHVLGHCSIILVRYVCTWTRAEVGDAIIVVS